MIHQAEQRSISIRILTTTGWVAGICHLPRMHSFLDFLNHRMPFIKMTQVALPHGGRSEFFALRKKAIKLIVPESEEDLQLNRPHVDHERQSVCCVFQDGAVDGTVGVLKGVRVSDHLLHNQGFLLLRDCQTHGADAQRAALVLVNTDQVIGVSAPGHQED